MICPHCRIGFHEKWSVIGQQIGDVDGTWLVQSTTCSECERVIVRLRHVPSGSAEVTYRIVRPKATGRAPVPIEVPHDYANDYTEACLVIADSPKASAALSRRCLQNLLVNVANANGGDLSKQIDDVLNAKQVPSYLAADIDAVRAVGNFAAHPMKSQSTGSIVPVEPEEADWLLGVLEGLFDFYFVEPAKSAVRRAAFNQKQQDAGKPPLKIPPT